MYIGPGQYFVITDIGRGRYQWYAFLARPADSEASEEKPEGMGPYLRNLFDGWSPEIHDIVGVTKVARRLEPAPCSQPQPYAQPQA